MLPPTRVDSNRANIHNVSTCHINRKKKQTSSKNKLFQLKICSTLCFPHLYHSTEQKAGRVHRLQGRNLPHFYVKESKIFSFRKVKVVGVSLENTISASSVCSSFEGPTEMLFSLTLQHINSNLKKKPNNNPICHHTCIKSNIQTPLVTAQRRVLWLTF